MFNPIEWLVWDFTEWFRTDNNGFIFWMLAIAVVIGVKLIENKLLKAKTEQTTNNNSK